MTLTGWKRRILGFVAGLIVTGLYLPLLLVVVNSLNTDEAMTWPPSGLTGQWWAKALVNEGVRAAMLSSVLVGLAATAIALVLGTLLAMALVRYDFFGKQTVNVLVVLPIALPGIVTGIALHNVFRAVMGIPLSIWTVIIAHATFTIVTVFNNAQARLRRLGTNLAEASSDLGAGPWTTFVRVTFPQLRSALLAGGLLAFALSFDEIIVTTFTAGAGVTTLPIWILNNLFRPNQAPVVAVVAVVMIVISVVPIWFAQRVSGDTEGVR